ncbi:MAG: redoxin family protein [Phycisphaerales bacterium]|nr:redoxin family protein [Phycisphaerales bacterium]
MRWFRCAAIAAAAAVVATTWAAGDLGDPAPKLEIGKWVKGEAVDLSKGKGKTIYVVEFWATWCPPCRASIPHLTELQKEYKDKNVVFIGVSDEPADTVSPFVDKQGDKMDYIVAVDNDKKETKQAWMGAYGIGGIPHAFVVDKEGLVIWHGHPMELDEPLKQIVEGKFDVKAAKEAAKKQKALEEKMQQAFPKVMQYFSMVSSEGENKEAAAIGRALVKDYGDVPAIMNHLSWNIMTGEEVKHRDMELALMAGQKAYDGAKEDPAIIDTYARALWENGKKAEAIQYQKKAVELCKDEIMKKDLERSLKRYESEDPQ